MPLYILAHFRQFCNSKWCLERHLTVFKKKMQHFLLLLLFKYLTGLSLRDINFFVFLLSMRIFWFNISLPCVDYKSGKSGAEVEESVNYLFSISSAKYNITVFGTTYWNVKTISLCKWISTESEQTQFWINWLKVELSQLGVFALRTCPR